MKNYISGIPKDFSTTFAVPKENDSSHISCDFHYNIVFDSKIVNEFFKVNE